MCWTEDSPGAVRAGRTAVGACASDGREPSTDHGASSIRARTIRTPRFTSTPPFRARELQRHTARATTGVVSIGSRSTLR